MENFTAIRKNSVAEGGRGKMKGIKKIIIGIITIMSIVFGKAYCLEVESITEITDPAAGISYSGGHWSPDGTKIAVTTDKGLEVMNADGSNKRIIVATATKDSGNFNWSSDGTKIVFEGRKRSQNPKEDTDNIWVVNTDGTGLKQLTNGNRDLNPVWSPDGNKIAFHRIVEEGKGIIWIVNSDGTNLIRVTPLADNFKYPLFSLDGTKIACVKNFMRPDSGLYITDIDGSNRNEIINKGYLPRKWSQDGSKIWCEQGITVNVTTKKVDEPVKEGVVSPDWKWIAYDEPKEAEGPGAEDASIIESPLFVIGYYGANKIQVTNELNMIFEPDEWSPDGKSLLATKSTGISIEKKPDSLVVIKFK